MATLAVSACSGATTEPSPTEVAPTTTTTVPGTTTTTIVALEAITAYEICLSENDVSIEPIPFDANGRPRLELVMRDVDFTDFDSVSALTLCAEHLSTGALDLSDSPVLKDSVGKLLTKFSECVRSRGVADFPDPIPGFTGIGGPYPPAEIPYSDPDLTDAIEACRERLQ